MQLPKLNEIATSRDMTDSFGGYNHNIKIAANEFYDMKNLSSDNHPLLSPRKSRGVYSSPFSCQGLIAKDALCYVDGEYFVVDGYKAWLGLSTNPDDCPKQLVSMGAYVIVLPDKKYINIANLEDKGDIEVHFTTTSKVSFELCKADGSNYSDINASTSSPHNPSNVTLWLDKSTTPHSLKQYSEATGTWTTIATTYIKIVSTGIGEKFKEGDGVTISGVENEKLQDLNGKMIIQSCGKDYIVVVGVLDEETEQTAPITVKRTMPHMDFVVESENRLWGCRYGVAENGEIVNEVYASSLGDFKNWNCFEGLSTDSYAATVGTDGPFTGAITYAGNPLFFKENSLHRVYGNYPSNYQISTTACRGVQKGSDKSLAIVNNVLYYKSAGAVCAYDGSLPVEISTQFGEIQYKDAIACAHNNKYYISMRTENQEEANWNNPIVAGNMMFIRQAYGAEQNGETLTIDPWYLPVQDSETLHISQAYSVSRTGDKLAIDRGTVTWKETWNFFVYDTAKKLWHKEDDLAANDFCSFGNEVYYIDKYDGQIKTLFGTGQTDVEDVSWMAETGILCTDTPDKKYISRIDVRMMLDVGSVVRFFADYDSSGEWTPLFTRMGNNLRSFTIPLRMRRCDHLRLRIEGSGDAKIFSISKTIEGGSNT